MPRLGSTPTSAQRQPAPGAGPHLLKEGFTTCNDKSAPRHYTFTDAPGYQLDFDMTPPSRYKPNVDAAGFTIAANAKMGEMDRVTFALALQHKLWCADQREPFYVRVINLNGERDRHGLDSRNVSLAPSS